MFSHDSDADCRKTDSRRWDPNMPDEAIEMVDAVTGTHDAKGEAQLVGEIIENSPYPEVRAVVRNYDEDVPASTIRAWTIGLILTTICSAVNALFLLRYPPITIGPYVVQLIAYPIGLAFAKVLPNKEFKIFGKTANLNPGTYNRAPRPTELCADSTLHRTIQRQGARYHCRHGQRCFRWWCRLLRRDCRFVEKVLSLRHQSVRLGLQHSVRPFNSVSWVRSCWLRQKIPCRARCYDLAWCSGQRRFHVCFARSQQS